MRRAWCIWVVGRLVAGMVGAQKPLPPPQAFGAVTGTVVCGDTQLPARFAEVMLVRRPTKAEIAKLFAPEGKGEPESAGKSAEVIDALEEHSGLDGSYTISRVPPGDYWVVARRDGYLFPIAFADDETEARDLDRLMAGAAQVHVAADSTAKVDIRLERGGTVTGHVLFEDGSPAVSWDVWLVPIGAKQVTPLASPYPGMSEALDPATRLGESTTDDEGNFRMAGIPPGRYLVAARRTIQSGRHVDDEGYPGRSSEQNIFVFAPGVFSRDQATPVEIHTAESISDIRVKLDLSRLHSIRGRVLIAKDRQPADDGSGLVTAQKGDYWQRVNVRTDGSFQVDFLPPGTYMLSVVPGFPDPKDRTRHYNHPQLTVTIENDDVTLNDILLSDKPPDKPKEKN